MFPFNIILALLFAVFVTAIVTIGFRRTGAMGFGLLLMLLFLAGWSASLWVVPMGPVFMDVHWLPILFMILIFTLLLVNVLPPARRRTPEGPVATEAEKAVGAVFWLLFVLLLVSIIGWYFWNGNTVILF